MCPLPHCVFVFNLCKRGGCSSGGKSSRLPSNADSLSSPSLQHCASEHRHKEADFENKNETGSSSAETLQGEMYPPKIHGKPQRYPTGTHMCIILLLPATEIEDSKFKMAGHQKGASVSCHAPYLQQTSVD